MRESLGDHLRNSFFPPTPEMLELADAIDEYVKLEAEYERLLAELEWTND